MANYDIVAIGASAGGVEALRFIAQKLPKGFNASVLMTIHLSSRHDSAFDQVLCRDSVLPACFAKDGEALEKSRIYLAPPERHLVVDHDRLYLGNGPRENGSRPAIDPMLRSLALCCAARTIGVVLTGTLGDGASGLWALKQAGGITVVQDPKDAMFAEMPMTALNRANPDHVVHLADLPALLAALVEQPSGTSLPSRNSLSVEVQLARGNEPNDTVNKVKWLDGVGRRSVLACPDCGGVMWEIIEGNVVRFRCHVGHAYTAEVLNVALEENLKHSLASALRALEERTALAQSLQDQAIDKGRMVLAEIWAERRIECQKEADVIRRSMQRIDELAVRFAERGSQAAE
ncbi:MAG TPA: chemotaxis protein CheB [Methylocella sp.]|nr:chemotaxis protein CheB [Methylocella sp.]